VTHASGGSVEIHVWPWCEQRTIRSLCNDAALLDTPSNVDTHSSPPINDLAEVSSNNFSKRFSRNLSCVSHRRCSWHPDSSAGAFNEACVSVGASERWSE
jgi:hypothetical protein